MKAQHFSYKDMTEILWGRYAGGGGSLSLSCKSIDEEPEVGETITREIYFKCSGDIENVVYGVAFSDNDRVAVTPENLRTGSGVITCTFNTEGLFEGTELKGNITLITNFGEFIIPYYLKLLPAYPASSIGRIKNLFHFTNLAKEEWDEALNIFGTDAFRDILRDSDARSRAYYKKLVTTWDKSQGMEEFLCAINKKDHITYETSFGERGIEISVLSEDELQVPIEIKKRGWGYTRIRVKTKGSFITTEKENIKDSDFLGNVCRFNVYLHRDGLINGFGRGEIILEGPYTDIRIPISVGRMQRMVRRRRREYMEKVSDFYRFYIDYVFGHIKRREWLEETEELLNSLRMYGKENVIWEMIRIHLLLTREKYSEAKNLLKRYYEGELIVEFGMDIGCYYLYLNSLAVRDPYYTHEVTLKIRDALMDEPDNFHLAWLLMYLDEEYAASPIKSWQLLNDHYDRGCSSPLLLLEAGELCREHPELLVKYSGFAAAVLVFLAKHKAITPELSGQAVYLAEHMKQVDNRMIMVLCECYELYAEDSVLKAVCGLYIQGKRIDREALLWYRTGIRREIWLTKLYEYYMLSVNLETGEEILPAALRYFSFSCELPFERCAYLYAYLVRNKSRYEEIYTTSLPMIEKALLGWLSRGLVNENVSRIFMDQWNIGREQKEKLFPYLESLFVHKIETGDASIKRFYVVDERDRNEPEYTAAAGISYVGIYTETARLVFEDYRGFRYVDPVGSRVTPVFTGKDAAKVLSERTDMNPRALADNVLLALWGAVIGGGVVTGTNFVNALELYSRNIITDAFKGDLGSRLVHFLDGDLKRRPLLESILNHLDGEIVPRNDRRDLIIMMIRLGLYRKAVDWLERYGWELLPPNWAFNLVNHMHREGGFEDSPVLMPLTLAAYNDKKYREEMLTYLAENYISDIHKMTILWQRCRDFGLDCVVLGEQLMLHMAFTGSYVPEIDEMLKEHILAGGRAPSGISALRYVCRRYMVHGTELSEIFKRELFRRYWQREKLEVIERIVILKLIREDASSVEDAEVIVKDLLPYTMFRDEANFSFFEDIAHMADYKTYDDGKVYLSFFTDNDGDIAVHFVRYLDDGSGDYQVEVMNSPCKGIHYKVFPMFPGERIKYHLTRKDAAGEDELIKDGILESPHRNDENLPTDPRGITGRYDAIDGIARAIARGDAHLAEDSIRVYYQKDLAADTLFSLL